AIEAVKLTNSWYFDIMMMALENRKSDALPEQTLVSAPKTEELLNKDFQGYFEQVSKKDLPGFTAGKVYTDSQGQSSSLIIEIKEQAISYKFENIAG
ncbi:MAG TPA: hypothetical protein VGC08_06700, partial [Pedobacter sp.]